MTTLRLTPIQRRTIERLEQEFPSNVYVVGGTIRDLLRAEPVHDLDLVVTNVALRTITKRLARFGVAKLVRTRFGVVKFRPQGQSFVVDIAVPRKERAHGTGGYQDFSFQPDPRLPIAQDLARRDLTINAMAYAWHSKTLIDPFHGTADLRRRIVRTVGKPEQRFAEDYSRLLRLLRFAVQLHGTVEEATARAAQRLMPKLQTRRAGRFVVPREVIAEQLIRTFLAQPDLALEVYDQFGVLALLLPEVAALHGCTQSPEFHTEGDVFVHTQLALHKLTTAAFRKQFGIAPTAQVIFAVLLHDVGKPARQRAVRDHGKRRIHFYGHDVQGAALARTISERLRLSSYQGLINTDELAWFVRHHLIGIRPTIMAMRPLTLVRYFSGERGAQLLQVLWADRAASLRPNGRGALADHHLLKRKLHAVFRQQQRILRAPKPLLNGAALIREFHIPEGPMIGRLLAALLEQQLLGTVRTPIQARAFLRTQLHHNDAS